MPLHLSRQGQGMPLVFFHGWAFDSQIWLPLMAALQSDYEVILVDLPGFGLSPMMDWESFSQALLARLPQQFGLVGWSMGGLYATRLAIEAPCRITHLFNITTSPYFVQAVNWPGLTRETLDQYKEALNRDHSATVDAFLQQANNDCDLVPVLGKKPSLMGLKFGLNAMSDWDFREKIHGLNLPVVYLFGGRDPIVTSKTRRSMALLYPDFNILYFKNAAHFPFLTYPQEIKEAMQSFFQ